MVIEHMVCIAWTWTMSTADVPLSRQVNSGERGTKPQYDVVRAHVYLVDKDSAPLQFIFHEFPKVLTQGENLLGLVSFFG